MCEAFDRRCHSRLRRLQEGNPRRREEVGDSSRVRAEHQFTQGPQLKGTAQLLQQLGGHDGTSEMLRGTAQDFG